MIVHWMQTECVQQVTCWFISRIEKVVYKTGMRTTVRNVPRHLPSVGGSLVMEVKWPQLDGNYPVIMGVHQLAGESWLFAVCGKVKPAGKSRTAWLATNVSWQFCQSEDHSIQPVSQIGDNIQEVDVLNRRNICIKCQCTACEATPAYLASVLNSDI